MTLKKFNSIIVTTIFQGAYINIMKKKIVLLGDSIRLGYGQLVPGMLGEDYEVWQSADNCRFAKYTLRMLFDEAENIKGAHVIHWNNGLWDATELFDDGTFSTEEEYVENMLRIARLLQKITPNVIFATITPTHPEYPYTRNDKIDRFNELIVPKLKDMGVAINDLNSLVKLHIEEYISPDMIHPNETGFTACAKQVVNAIKQFD